MQSTLNPLGRLDYLTNNNLGPAQWEFALLQVMGIFFTDVQITY